MLEQLIRQQPGTFGNSVFVPLAIGFFGLGTGYLIYGPQELFGFPKRDSSVDRGMGIWGGWMPGFLQFITGVYILVGLTWFQVFATKPLLYMAGLAFTAYGVHWFATGITRFLGTDPRPNGFLAIPFFVLSVLGMLVFFAGGDWPVALVFVGLTGIYVGEFFSNFGSRIGERWLGFCRLITGLWLMYLTYAITVDFSLKWDWPM